MNLSKKFLLICVQSSGLAAVWKKKCVSEIRVLTEKIHNNLHVKLKQMLINNLLLHNNN